MELSNILSLSCNACNIVTVFYVKFWPSEIPVWETYSNRSTSFKLTLSNLHNFYSISWILHRAKILKHRSIWCVGLTSVAPPLVLEEVIFCCLSGCGQGRKKSRCGEWIKCKWPPDYFRGWDGKHLMCDSHVTTDHTEASLPSPYSRLWMAKCFNFCLSVSLSSGVCFSVSLLHVLKFFHIFSVGHSPLLFVLCGLMTIAQKERNRCFTGGNGESGWTLIKTTQSFIPDTFTNLTILHCNKCQYF